MTQHFQASRHDEPITTVVTWPGDDYDAMRPPTEMGNQQVRRAAPRVLHE
jgi:hypothetical protein